MSSIKMATFLQPVSSTLRKANSRTTAGLLKYLKLVPGAAPTSRTEIFFSPCFMLFSSLKSSIFLESLTLLKSLQKLEHNPAKFLKEEVDEQGKNFHFSPARGEHIETGRFQKHGCHRWMIFSPIPFRVPDRLWIEAGIRDYAAAFFNWISDIQY